MNKEDWILLGGIAIGAYFLYQISQSAKTAAGAAQCTAASAANAAACAAAASCAAHNPLSTIGSEIASWF